MAKKLDSDPEEVQLLDLLVENARALDLLEDQTKKKCVFLIQNKEKLLFFSASFISQSQVQNVALSFFSTKQYQASIKVYDI